MKKFRLAILTSALILVGCKTEISATIPFSEMFSSGIKETSAELKIEVPACEDFEDSRKESDSLVRARDEIIKIMPTAKFTDCHKEKFESFATFSLPINFGQATIEEWEKVSNISLITPAAPNGQNELGSILYIPNEIQKSIEKSQNDPFSMNKIEISNIKIRINFKNDIDKEVTAMIPSAFVNGEPSQTLEFTIGKAKTAEVLLSDVSTHIAFNSKSNDIPFILKNIRFN